MCSQKPPPNSTPNYPPPAYSELPSNVLSGNNVPYQSNYVPVSPNAPPLEHYNSAVPNYGSTVLIVNEPVRRQVIISRGQICPICNIGTLECEFTLLGILLAIFLFPFGLIFLCLLREWRCSICRRSF